MGIEFFGAEKRKQQSNIAMIFVLLNFLIMFFLNLSVDDVISEEWLTELKRRVDLVELGARYGVTWIQRGQQTKACCPFHDERTPSFHIMDAPRRGLPRFICYGACGETWSAIRFLTEGMHREFLEAIQELAEMAGMEVPRKGEIEEARRAREAAKAKRAAIYQAIELAQAYFVRALQADRPEASQARAYIAARALTPAIESWGLGYAPQTGGLIQWLDHHEVDPDIAHEAYLVRQGENGRYAFQRNRITIPWRNRRGTIVSHVGRLLADGEPKYLNAGEIPGIFVKGQLVFGLHEASQHIHKTGEAWITEGQLSAITSHLHGLGYVIACGGTAFTATHARNLLGAGASRAIFLMEGDNAARKGVRAAIPIALREGLAVRVTELSEGMDPDDFLRASA